MEDLIKELNNAGYEGKDLEAAVLLASAIFSSIVGASEAEAHFKSRIKNFK